MSNNHNAISVIDKFSKYMKKQWLGPAYMVALFMTSMLTGAYFFHFDIKELFMTKWLEITLFGIAPPLMAFYLWKSTGILKGSIFDPND